MKLIQQILSVLTEEPKKQDEIVLDLNKELAIPMNTRTLRKHFKAINEDFINGTCEWLIVSDSKGSYKTKDNATIRRFNQAKKNHALSELYMAYNANKRLTNDLNMSFDDYVKEVINERP